MITLENIRQAFHEGYDAGYMGTMATIRNDLDGRIIQAFNAGVNAGADRTEQTDAWTTFVYEMIKRVDKVEE